MTDFERVLINRDHMTVDEAKRARAEARQAIWEMIEDGASYDDVEDMMSAEYGLEMDYIEELI